MLDKARELHEDLEVEVFSRNLMGRKFYLKYGFVMIEEKIHEDTGHKILRLKFSANKTLQTDAAKPRR